MFLESSHANIVPDIDAMPEIREILVFVAFMRFFISYMEQSAAVRNWMQADASASTCGNSPPVPNEDGILRGIWADATDGQARNIRDNAVKLGKPIRLSRIHQNMTRGQSGKEEEPRFIWPGKTLSFPSLMRQPPDFQPTGLKLRGVYTDGRNIYVDLTTATLEVSLLLHTSPQFYTLERWEKVVCSSKSGEKGRGFKIVIALQFESHVLAFVSMDLLSKIRWCPNPFSPPANVATFESLFDNVNGVSLLYRPRWFNSVTPKRPRFVNPAKESFMDYLAEACIWWIAELGCYDNSHGLGKIPIWRWLRESKHGGESPFRGCGAYTVEEILFYSGIPPELFARDCIRCPSRFTRLLLAFWSFASTVGKTDFLAQSQKWWKRRSLTDWEKAAAAQFPILNYTPDVVTMAASEEQKIAYGSKYVAIHGQSRIWTSARHRDLVDAFNTCRDDALSQAMDPFEPLFLASAEYDIVSDLIFLPFSRERVPPPSRSPLHRLLYSLYENKKTSWIDCDTHAVPQSANMKQDDISLNQTWLTPALYYQQPANSKDMDSKVDIIDDDDEIEDDEEDTKTKVKRARVKMFWSVLRLRDCRKMPPSEAAKKLMVNVKRYSANWTVGPLDFCGVCRVWNDANRRRFAFILHNKDDLRTSFLLKRQILGRKLRPLRRKVSRAIKTGWRTLSSITKRQPSKADRLIACQTVLSSKEPARYRDKLRLSSKQRAYRQLERPRDLYHINTPSTSPSTNTPPPIVSAAVPGYTPSLKRRMEPLPPVENHLRKKSNIVTPPPTENQPWKSSVSNPTFHFGQVALNTSSTGPSYFGIFKSGEPPAKRIRKAPAVRRKGFTFKQVEFS